MVFKFGFYNFTLSTLVKTLWYSIKLRKEKLEHMLCNITNIFLKVTISYNRNEVVF